MSEQPLVWTADTCLTCFHPRKVHVPGAGCLHLDHQAFDASRCAAFLEDEDPRRCVPDCDCGHTHWVHYQSVNRPAGMMTVICPGLVDGPPCPCTGYATTGQRLRTATTCLCGHLVSDHGAREGHGLLRQSETPIVSLRGVPREQRPQGMGHGSTGHSSGMSQNGPLGPGCQKCACLGESDEKPYHVCCSRVAPHYEGSGCE